MSFLKYNDLGSGDGGVDIDGDIDGDGYGDVDG